MKTLIVQYVVVTVVYAMSGSWWKALYFLSATGISIAVLGMK